MISTPCFAGVPSPPCQWPVLSAMGKCSEWTLAHTGYSETLWTPRPWGHSLAHPKFHDLLTNWLLETPPLAAVLGSSMLSVEIPLGMALWGKISLRRSQVNWPLHTPKLRFCFTVNTHLCSVVSGVNLLPNWHSALLSQAASVRLLTFRFLRPGADMVHIPPPGAYFNCFRRSALWGLGVNHASSTDQLFLLPFPVYLSDSSSSLRLGLDSKLRFPTILSSPFASPAQES